MNALSAKMLEELSVSFLEVEQDSNCRVITIWGSGNSFIAGADIQEFNSDPDRAKQFILAGHKLMKQITEIEKPVIAVVDGYCLGGGLEFALACDFILAGSKAVFGLPEVGLGLIPGFGGTQRLALKVGPSKAKQLIFTGLKINAVEAERIGLVDQLIENMELEVEKIVSTISSKAPLAVKKAKQLVNSSYADFIFENLKIEVQEFLNLLGTVDAKEGIQAFFEKRSAKFLGK